jgi:hypothetical protein
LRLCGLVPLLGDFSEPEKAHRQLPQVIPVVTNR